MKFLLLLFALATMGLVSCTQTTPDTLALRSPAPAERTAPQPYTLPFPDDRQSTALTEYVLAGSSAELVSSGAIASGSALELPAAPGGFEYALYRFNVGTTPGALDSVSVVLTEPATTEAWIGLADYAAGRWELSGPYSKPKTLAVDDARYVSPAGNLWVAVLAPAEQHAAISALSVRTINPANQPPTATLNATGATGAPPRLVSFDAADSFDSDGVIIEYAWDFDSDGLYDGYTDLPAAQHNYEYPGSYQATLRVRDDQLATDTTTIGVTVQSQPNAQLTAEPGLSGQPGGSILLDGSASSGGIVKYEWDLNGDGTFEKDTDATAFTLYTLPTPGHYDVGLLVTDAVGAQDSASLTLTSTGWANASPNPDSAGNVGTFTSLAVINGNPAIAYRDSGGSTLKYAYSSTVNGNTGWSTVTLGPADRAISLAEINGRPAISYRNGGDINYAYSNTADGSSGWSSITVGTGTSQDTSLALVNGKPALCYGLLVGGGGGVDSELHYAYSSTTDGSSGWTDVVAAIGFVAGEYCSLAVVNDKPAIAYYAGGLSYAYSSTLDGSSGWSSVSVEGGASNGYQIDLAIVAGTPAISYRHEGLDELRYAWSSVADGSSGWNAVTLAAGGNAGFRGTSLEVVAGRPAICFSQADSLRYVRALNAAGSLWGVPTVLDGSVPVTGQYPSLAIVNSQPAVSYYEATRQDLRYIRHY